MGCLVNSCRECANCRAGHFCADHGIDPEVEVIPPEQINQAWDRVLASDVRFRFVIDISTLAS